MLLNSKFDILRGWPREGAIDDTFPVHITGSTPDVVPMGMVVKVGLDGAVVAATTPNRTTTPPTATWIVVEGNNDYSGTFLNKAVCLRSNAEFRLDPSNFVAGAYVVGSKLTFDTGLWRLAVATEQIIGEVLSNDVAVDGTLRVFYTGGDAAML